MPPGHRAPGLKRRKAEPSKDDSASRVKALPVVLVLFRFPFGVSGFPSGHVAFPEGITPLPLIESLHLSEYFDMSRTGYSVPRLPCNAAFRLVLGVFRNMPSPQSRDNGSSSLRLRLSFRDPSRHRRSPPPQQAEVSDPGSSHEVFRPYNAQSHANRHIVGFHPNAIPSRPFSDPQGFNPRSTLRPYCMPLSLIGFWPFKAFPLRRTLPASSTGDTLSAFLLRHPKTPEPAPSGLCILRKTVANRGVLHPLSARFLLGLSHLHGLL